MMQPYELARSQVGVRWRHQGRKPGKWLDCIGLIVYAFKDYGIQDRNNYQQHPSMELLESELTAQFGRPIQSGRINMSALRLNDVVTFGFPSVMRHVGIIGSYEFNGGGMSIIHAAANVGLITESRLDRPWPRLIKRVYRLGELPFPVSR